eukprot:TRINITY_DN1809_c0_g1_i8.p1 TRINITY_DN1809_c0_g1~~TRINITY_DN1809_c0_g1_i8.p1  ORF type:complete len:178 (+),score=16.87 TRINITY_DN1809_c0_g1_i8:44-577(+)
MPRKQKTTKKRRAQTPSGASVKSLFGPYQYVVLKKGVQLCYYVRGSFRYAKFVAAVWNKDHPDTAFAEGGDPAKAIDAKSISKIFHEYGFDPVTFIDNQRTNFVKVVRTTYRSFFPGASKIILCNNGKNPLFYEFVSFLNIPANSSTVLFVFLTLEDMLSDGVSISIVNIRGDHSST